MGVFLEDLLDEGYVRKRDIVLPNLLEDLINLTHDLFASLDGVGVGLMEVVGGSIEEFHKTVGCQLGHHAVGLLFGDVELVVFHGGGAEQRHSTDCTINV